MVLKYPWNDDRFRKIRDIKDSREFTKRLRELIKIWKKEGKVRKNIPNGLILQAGTTTRYRNKRRGIERKCSNIFERMSSEDQESFLKDMESMNNIELAQKYGGKYPKFNSNNIGQVININLGGRKKGKKKKETNVFDAIPGLKERLAELIQEGVLVKKGLDHIHSVLSKEFKDALQEKRFTLTKKFLRENFEDIAWDKNALDFLNSFVREGLSLAPVYNRLSSILTRKMIDAKAKKQRGIRPGESKKKSTTFEAGIGRIATDAEVERVQKEGILELQNYTIDRPFEITTKKKDNFYVMVINGPHLGLEYNRVLEENVLRNALRHAQRIGVDAVIITAGLMWTDIKKSSGRLTTHRALYHGLDFDPDVLDPEYRDEAIEIRKNLPPNRISFATFRERVMNAFGGWHKVTLHKRPLPIFEGPVFFSFGYPEEEMIENAAHEHLRYLKVCMESEARSKRRVAEAELEYELTNNCGKENEETKRLREEVQRLLRLEKRKSANTNIERIDHKRFVSIIRTLLVSWYQDAIPNAQFIGQGTIVCDIGGRKVEIQQASHERPTEKDISDLIRSVGQRDLDGTLPDIILGAGAYNLNARWSARECMRNTKKDQVHVWQLPVLIDRDYVHEAKAEMIKRGSPIERLISGQNFEPGAFILGMTDGIWNSHPLPISMFTQRYPIKHKRSAPPKEIIFYAEGDQHYGNPSKEYVWDARTQQRLPMEVAASEIFMREFVEKGNPLPFHIFSSHGDTSQAHHFPTEQNRHPQHESMGVLDIESADLLRRIKAGKISEDKLKEEASELISRLNEQIRLRGEHWYQQQLEDVIDTSIERRTSFFLEILKRGKTAGIKTRGIAQVLLDKEHASDRRDLGMLNFLDGNHGGKTTLGTFFEAWTFARICLLSILAEDNNPFTRKELKRLVRSPIFGPVASGYGLVSATSEYEWGIHLRHDPTRKSGQDGDPLARATKNLAERGDYGFIFNRKNFITIVGDQHRYAAAYGPNKVVFNCACSTHGDSYGDDWGFSRSNLGGLIICVPADGPGAGPVRMIPISHIFIREYMAKPWKIDWKKLFPNPA